MDLLEIKKIAENFLMEALELSQKPKVIGTIKVGDGWEVSAQVFEESAFIKSLGLNTEVQDRHTYEVSIDKKGNVTAYNRQNEEE